MASPTLFTTYLKMLGVPHTATYSDREYKSYPPRLAFMAFQDLLYEYRIDRHLTSGEATGASLRGLRLPCVAAMADGTPRIITAIDGDTVHYTSCKGDGSMPLSGFLNNWSGKSIEAGVTGRSAEPEWRKHRLAHVAAVTEHYAFWLLTAALALFFFFYNGLYSSWSMTLLTLLYALGTMVCWMLTLKQNNVRSASASAADIYAACCRCGGIWPCSWPATRWRCFSTTRSCPHISTMNAATPMTGIQRHHYKKLMSAIAPDHSFH